MVKGQVLGLKWATLYKQTIGTRLLTLSLVLSGFILAKYQANVTKRGHVKGSTSSDKKVAKKSSVNPYLVGFLLVVLCGGAFFEVLRLFGAGVDAASF